MPRYSFGIVLYLTAVLPLRAADKIEFNRDIRPILSEHCFQCHGPDKAKRKADLRLDDRAAALGKEAILPGKSAESELVVRIQSKDAESLMPPPETHKPLKPGQIELLRKWIDQGAEYQPHWAYINPVRPAVPNVHATAKPNWMANPIDAFVLKALEAKAMHPSAEADKRRLIRRVYLDLLGLPPSSQAVEKFLADKDPQAYEKLVDELLTSEHYGERMAQPWLDLVRFADTVGYHGDQNQRIFPYRDYVIDSFIKNKPFDQFTREQIAGDLLPNPTAEQLVASGYNRLNMMTREGGAQAKEYLAKYQADRVRTTSITWLGSTFGCAECHDHKYDPIKAKDFYSMAAFFADLKQWGVYSDYGYTPNADLKGFTNDYPFPPEIEVESEYLKTRIHRVEDAITKMVEKAMERVKAHKDRAAEERRWKESEDAYYKPNKTGWITPVPKIVKDGVIEKDNSILVSSNVVKGASNVIELSPPQGFLNSVRLEILPHSKHGDKIARDGAATTTVQLSLSIKGKDGKERKLPLFYGEADHSEPIKYSSTVPITGLLDGWRTSKNFSSSPHTAIWLLDKPAYVKEGETLEVTLKSDNVGCVRVSLSAYAWPNLKQADYYEYTRTSPNDIIIERFGKPFHPEEILELLSTNVDPEFTSEARRLLKSKFELNHGKAWTQVSVSTKPMETRILPRGNFLDETGPVVEPATPGFLPQLPKKAGRLARLDLADWIVSKENPLTARVFVNRLWKQFFGTGISAVMEDVGAQGEWPSHPELLDWLAVEFRDGGWDVKHMVKLIVTSATYRQDSKARPEYREIDPNNRLLSFMPPRRLEAEFVRDNALAIAGLLNHDVGGPSAKPYQPAGYYANIQFPNRNYVADTGDLQYRRGLYMHWQRTFLHPMLANFDAPSREECIAARNNANTPQQALTLLNDPTFVEAARALAENLLESKAKTDADRLNWLFQRAICRPASAKEIEALSRFAATQKSQFAAQPEDAAKAIRIGMKPLDEKLDAVELAAWMAVCRVVLNLHETITRY